MSSLEPPDRLRQKDGATPWEHEQIRKSKKVEGGEKSPAERDVQTKRTKISSGEYVSPFPSSK